MGFARDIAKMVRRMIKAAFADVHTHLPAQVVSYNALTNTATIQPCINRFRTEDPDNETVTLPEIEDVPVQLVGSGKLFCHRAPQVGSYGVLHVSEREIETWMLKGGVVDPQSSRRFDISDGFFEPGIYPLMVDGNNGLIVPPLPTDRIGFRTRLGNSEISLLDDGSVEIAVLTADSVGATITLGVDCSIAIDNATAGSSITLGNDGSILATGPAGYVSIPVGGTVDINGNLTVLP